MLAKLFYQFYNRIFSSQTQRFIAFDLLRLRAYAKLIGKKDILPVQRKLHFGCGTRFTPGWLNVDVANSEHDIDLAGGRLPWKSKVFDVAVGQHVIEHLDLLNECIPLLQELQRVLKSGGELWLSSPDMEKLCHSYLKSKMTDLLWDRKQRFPEYSLGMIPSQYMLNDLFHQDYMTKSAYGFVPLDSCHGAHKNLYDFTLLEWALIQAKFVEVKRVDEDEFLERFHEFSPRGDDMQSIYVRAIAMA